MTVQVTTTATGRIALTSPYNAGLPAEARKLGGRWDGAAKAWTFDARDEQRVRELARRFYGTDGSPEETADLVTVRVKVSDHEVPHREGARAEFAGRIIAERPSRDADVRLAPNVVLISGEFFGTGGSMRYPQIDAADDVIVEIRDIPRASLAIEADDSYEIIEQRTDVDALRAERERLVARLAEIDVQLAAAGAPVEETDADRAVPANRHTAGVITVTIPAIDLGDATGASTADYAAAVGVSIRTVQRRAAAGLIPAVRAGRRWLITT